NIKYPGGVTEGMSVSGGDFANFKGGIYVESSVGSNIINNLFYRIGFGTYEQNFTAISLLGGGSSTVATNFFQKINGDVAGLSDVIKISSNGNYVYGNISAGLPASFCDTAIALWP